VPNEPDAWGDGPRSSRHAAAVRPARSVRPARPARRRPRGVGTTAALAAAIFGGIGLIVSLTGLAIQLLPRHFSTAQQRQIMAWEVSKRWRSLPAGDIFPASVRYDLPAATLADLTGVSLQAPRVGIAPQATCADGTDAAAARVLIAGGCQALLRGTYTDESATYVLTVGVAVLPSAARAAAAQAAITRAGNGSPLAPGVHAVPFGGTLAGSFGDAERQISRSLAAGPYVILYTAGYADGRPRVPIGNDQYAESEMTSAAQGVAQAVASTLAAPPAPPSCPGAPGC
jgi:hypothetical protein